ncbi:hypothetical protein HQ585_05390 [candidate division KSB1 bacterium]|nr:hypothetical protein [candidate division KSB1 bacterium]
MSMRLTCYFDLVRVKMNPERKLLCHIQGQLTGGLGSPFIRSKVKPSNIPFSESRIACDLEIKRAIKNDRPFI